MSDALLLIVQLPLATPTVIESWAQTRRSALSA